MSEYLNQIIPLPFIEDLRKSLEKQTEIAEHIMNLQNQAKYLQNQAVTVLEAAKKQVEKMIIGE
ncbi:MAG: hypothetical protein LLG13_14695 [Bacteroidales bacterium]|nr:hypothetical protein [Bacteroidales bacterium]